MKIRERGETPEVRSAREFAQQELERIKAAKQKKASGELEGVEAELLKGGDRVDVGLSKFIQGELDPEAMQAERKKRIEELKKLVAEGKYNPPVKDVARAVAQELSLEIMTSQVQFEGEDEE